MKKYDIFIGRIDGWHTFRTAQNCDDNDLASWLNKGYRIATEHKIGWFLHEVYLVKI